MSTWVDNTRLFFLKTLSRLDRRKQERKTTQKTIWPSTMLNCLARQQVSHSASTMVRQHWVSSSNQTLCQPNSTWSCTSTSTWWMTTSGQHVFTWFDNGGMSTTLESQGSNIFLKEGNWFQLTGNVTIKDSRQQLAHHLANQIHLNKKENYMWIWIPTCDSLVPLSIWFCINQQLDNEMAFEPPSNSPDLMRDTKKGKLTPCGTTAMVEVNTSAVCNRSKTTSLCSWTSTVGSTRILAQQK